MAWRNFEEENDMHSANNNNNSNVDFYLQITGIWIACIVVNKTRD